MSLDELVASDVLEPPPLAHEDLPTWVDGRTIAPLDLGSAYVPPQCPRTLPTSRAGGNAALVSGGGVEACLAYAPSEPALPGRSRGTPVVVATNPPNCPSRTAMKIDMTATPTRSPAVSASPGHRAMPILQSETPGSWIVWLDRLGGLQDVNGRDGGADALPELVASRGCRRSAAAPRTRRHRRRTPRHRTGRPLPRGRARLFCPARWSSQIPSPSRMGAVDDVLQLVQVDQQERERLAG